MAQDAPTLEPSPQDRSPYSRRELILAFLGAFFGWAFIAILFAILLKNDTILFWFHEDSPRDPMAKENFVWKLEFVAKWSVLPVSWLVFYLYFFSSRRGFSEAANPLSGHEALIELHKNIFTNSIEQFVMSMALQITLISWISAVKTQVIIPMLSLSFVVGRILFSLGYPKRRSFGISLTMFPCLVITIYSLFMFLSHVSIYPTV